MGQNESSFKRTYQETVAQLSTVQLGEIAARSVCFTCAMKYICRGKYS